MQRNVQTYALLEAQFMRWEGGADHWTRCKADKAIAERLHHDPSRMASHLKPQALHLAQTPHDGVRARGKQPISRGAAQLYSRWSLSYRLAADACNRSSHSVCQTPSAAWARPGLF